MTVAAQVREQGLPEGLRDRKKRETRMRIHRAALTVALAKGRQQCTVEEIAAAADVSPRTFFNYFGTKEDALIGADPERIDALVEAFLRRPADEEIPTALRVIFTVLVSGYDVDRELWRMRCALAEANPDLSARLVGAGDRLERALVGAAYQRSGTLLADDLMPAMHTHVALGALRTAVAQHQAADFTGDLVARLDAAYAVVQAGHQAGTSAGRSAGHQP